MMNWLYYDDDNGELQLLDKTVDLDGCYGFVYKITNKETGKFYIGKKIFKNTKTKQLTKKETQSLPIARGRTPSKKKIITESNWKEYWGSSKELLDDIKTLGKDKFERIILDFCLTKKQLTYSEIYHQMVYRVLFIDSYNLNILGKFFKRDFA